MSGIARVSEKMKKKMSFGDYTLSSSEETPKPVQQAAVVPIVEASPPRKVYALSKEDTQKLQAIFSKRLNTPNQSSIAQIMSEAITLLHQREF
jgi:hypothetical protein